MRSAVSVLIVALAMVGCGSEQPSLEGAAAHEAQADHHAEGEHAEGDRAHGDGAHGNHAAPHQEAEATGPRPTRVMDDGARLFGAEPAGTTVTALADIVASPAQFDGQVVSTSGTIERVCQRMGCWMELRGENAPAVRVPMAGHAFFLPRDVEGRAATIEGRVAVQELSAEAREHLASEGALATASSLSIDATSVVVR